MKRFKKILFFADGGTSPARHWRER